MVVVVYRVVAESLSHHRARGEPGVSEGEVSEVTVSVSTQNTCEKSVKSEYIGVELNTANGVDRGIRSADDDGCSALVESGAREARSFKVGLLPLRGTSKCLFWR